MKKVLFIFFLLVCLFGAGCTKHPEPEASKDSAIPSQIIREEMMLLNDSEVRFRRITEIQVNWEEKTCVRPFSEQEKKVIQQLLDKTKAIKNDDEIISFSSTVLEQANPVVDKNIYKVRSISHFIETNEYMLFYVPYDNDAFWQGKYEELAFEIVLDGDEMQLLHACWISPSDFSE